MAVKQTPIYIENRLEGGGYLIVWSDLDDEQIQGIEGVHQAIREDGARVAVYLDPRYKAEDVIQEIRALGGGEPEEPPADEESHPF
jgi:hypothetical protein